MIKPIVSIIISIYNIENYVAKCINSVIGQTYTNLDIVIVDDGSTDRSYKIVFEIAGADSRVNIIRKMNGGLSSARNSGLDAAKGEFVLFLDGDDYIEKDTIEKLVNCFKDDSISIAVGCADEVINNQRHENNNYNLITQTLSSNNVIEKYFLETKSIFLSVCFKLYKMEIFKKIRFKEGIIHEDAYIFPEIYKQPYNIACINDILFHYVQRKDSITHISLTDTQIDLEIQYRKFLMQSFSYDQHLYELSVMSYLDALIDYGKKYSDQNKLKNVQHILRKTIKLLKIQNMSTKKIVKMVIAFINIRFIRLLGR